MILFLIQTIKDKHRERMAIHIKSDKPDRGCRQTDQAGSPNIKKSGEDQASPDFYHFAIASSLSYAYLHSFNPCY